MKQVQIKKSNVVTHQAHFPALEEAQAWVAYHSNEGNFGDPSVYEVEITDIAAQKEQEQINLQSYAYLASTDWLIIRELDSGIPCPVEVKTARQAARDAIVN